MFAPIFLRRRLPGTAALVAVAVMGSACGSENTLDPIASPLASNGNNPPSQPTSLATPEPVVSVNGTMVTVSWSAVARADEYQVVSTAPGIHTPKTSATSVVSDVPGGEYTVKVRARTTSTNNESGFSREVAFSVAAPTPAAVRDETPPVITSAVAGRLGNAGWYTSDATLTWTVVDGESPFTSTGCEVVTVASDTRGDTYTCSATSEGGSSSASVTIKLDETVPAVSFNGSTAYTVDQSVSITCAATDGMSGLFATSCPNASGEAYLFNVGANVLLGTAIDKAGNENSASTTFTVSVTAGSMCNLVRRFVSHHGIANSLCVKLDAAAAAEARGNLKAEAGALNAFALEVKAQTGKHITAANAAILLRLVAYL